MNYVMQHIRRIRGFPLLCAAVLLGVCLLLPNSTGSGTIASDNGIPEEISVMCAYEEHLAHKIAQMTDTLLGCENTRVFVTLAAIPAEDTESRFGSQNRTREVSVPQPVGIAVACCGGDEAAVQLCVTNMLTSVFDLPAGCVFVGENRSAAVPNER